MSITIDCGEGKHAICRGRGKHHFLIPQLNDGAEFECACPCHDHQEVGGNRAQGDPATGAFLLVEHPPIPIV